MLRIEVVDPKRRETWVDQSIPEPGVLGSSQLKWGEQLKFEPRIGPRTIGLYLRV